RRLGGALGATRISISLAVRKTSLIRKASPVTPVKTSAPIKTLVESLKTTRRFRGTGRELGHNYLISMQCLKSRRGCLEHPLLCGRSGDGDGSPRGANRGTSRFHGEGDLIFIFQELANLLHLSLATPDQDLHGGRIGFHFASASGVPGAKQLVDCQNQ